MFRSIKEQLRRRKSLKKIARETPKLWLLEDRGVGYIQIPKVATRSIRAAFTKSILEARGQVVYYETLLEETIESVKSESTVSISQDKIRKKYPDLFLFTFIRDPFERLYSCYKNKVIAPLTNGKRNVLAKHDIELGISFEEFVERVSAIPDEQADRHIRSQSWFITHNDKLMVDFVGRLDHFAEDWRIVADQYNLPSPPVWNTTQQVTDLVDGFDQALRLKVEQRYWQDVELYRRVNG